MKKKNFKNILLNMQQLLQQGVCQANSELSDLLTGIAAPSEPASQTEQKTFVAARLLLQLRQRVENDNEAMAAILAIKEEIRQPWLTIMAARAKEAGQMKQPEPLVQLVTTLARAAAWVEASLPKAKLAPTDLGDLERKLFGTVAESAQATPILCRVLAAAAWLHSRRQPLPPIRPVDETGMRPDYNWCKGRLLELPHTQPDKMQSISQQGLQSYLLSGTIDQKPSETDDQEPLPWVLCNPWIFLLTSLVYAQDSWAAEQRGGLLLELPSGQNPFSPNQIQVLVADSAGNEQLCGTLAEFILRWLERRQVHLFPATPKTGELDSRLGRVVQAMLTRKVWRYSDGLSGQQGYYGINDNFADLCYRRLGSKIFQRFGKTIWLDFRVLAEEMRYER